MTTRVFTSPMFLGFDHLEQILERASKTSSDGYPPYNIEQTGPSGLRITLAVAGFTMNDLQITQEDNQLVIRGRQTEDGQDRDLSAPRHRGAAVSAGVRAGRGDRGQGRVARQRAAAHRPGPAAAGGAGADDPDHQAGRPGKARWARVERM